MFWSAAGKGAARGGNGRARERVEDSPAPKKAPTEAGAGGATG